MPLPNKPGEPSFQLKFEPNDAISLKWEKGRTSSTEFTITNTTGDWQSYKVKCTDNVLFRVRPPMGFIEPYNSYTARVYHNSLAQPDKDKQHYFVVYHTRCSDNYAKGQDAKKVWNSHTRPQGILRLPVRFEIMGSSSPSGPIASTAIPTPTVVAPPASSSPKWV